MPFRHLSLWIARLIRALYIKVHPWRVTYWFNVLLKQLKTNLRKSLKNDTIRCCTRGNDGARGNPIPRLRDRKEYPKFCTVLRPQQWVAEISDNALHHDDHFSALWPVKRYTVPPGVGNSRAFLLFGLSRAWRYDIQAVSKGPADDANESLCHSDICPKGSTDCVLGLFGKMHPCHVNIMLEPCYDAPFRPFSERFALYRSTPYRGSRYDTSYHNFLSLIALFVFFFATRVLFLLHFNLGCWLLSSCVCCACRIHCEGMTLIASSTLRLVTLLHLSVVREDLRQHRSYDSPTKNLQLCCTYGIVLIVGHISGGERHLFVFIFFKKLNAFLRLVFRSDTMACDLIVYSVYCTQSRICVVVLWPQSLYICRRKNRHINYQLVHWMSTGRSNGLMWWTNTRTLGVLSVDGFVCSSRYTLLVSIDMQRHRIRVDSSSYCGAIA